MLGRATAALSELVQPERMLGIGDAARPVIADMTVPDKSRFLRMWGCGAGPRSLEVCA
jgi:hypothetical protein